MDEFGDRITDPPTSEEAMTSLGVGCALVGLAGPLLILFGAPRAYLRAVAKPDSDSSPTTIEGRLT